MNALIQALRTITSTEHQENMHRQLEEKDRRMEAILELLTKNTTPNP